MAAPPTGVCRAGMVAAALSSNGALRCAVRYWKGSSERVSVFSEFNNLPLHALAVHAAVVSVPLAALLAVLFAIPRTRGWARLPLALVSVGAVGAVYVAKESGEKLEPFVTGPGIAATPVVHRHAEAADRLWWGVVAFAVVAVTAYLVSGSAERFRGALALAVCVVVVVGGALVAFQTYRVGDLGARATWNPTGGTDYKTPPTP